MHKRLSSLKKFEYHHSNSKPLVLLLINNYNYKFEDLKEKMTRKEEKKKIGREGEITQIFKLSKKTRFHLQPQRFEV